MSGPLRRLWGKSGGDRVSAERVQELSVDKVFPGPYQPRRVFSDEGIDELVETIRRHGLIQPIVVRPVGEGFEVIAGERRLRAVKRLGLPTIPAIVRELGDREAAALALIENLQRESLSPIEEAIAYQKLMELHGLTQEALARELGKSQSTIANKLRLLSLPGFVQEALAERRISERHARALLAVTDEEALRRLLAEITERELTVKETEARVRALVEGKRETLRKGAKGVFRGNARGVARDLRIALNTLRRAVEMVRKAGFDAEVEEHVEEGQVVLRVVLRKRT